MARRISVFIPVGEELTITAEANSSGRYDYIRPTSSASKDIGTLSAGASVTLGPFNEGRYYDITTIKGSISYSLSYAGIYTGADKITAERGVFVGWKVRQTSSQTLTSGVATKLEFNIVDLDTEEAYDETTNHRYTPTIAGLYQVNSVAALDNTDNEYVYVYIYKNGSSIGGVGFPDTALNGTRAASYSTVVEMNGTTDYLEVFCLCGDTTPQTRVGSNVLSEFSGGLLGTT